MQMLCEEKSLEIIQSPLNYTGGKFKLLPQILPLFPKNIDIFVDLFCGGGNVGINVQSNRTIFNDTDDNLTYLFNTFKNLGNDFLNMIDEVIEKYGLSQSDKYGYEYYKCNSNTGLAPYNKDKFLRLREDFNKIKNIDYYYYTLLYVLIIYSFNNQIRFNSQGRFNLPVGKRDFNEKMRLKLKNFIERLEGKNFEFSNLDFRKFDISKLNESSFVYADPPYLITCATYNEQGGWNSTDENDLLIFLDKLHEKNIKFALSNVLRSKGKENSILINWAEKNSDKYKVINLNYDYKNSNYQTKNKEAVTEEVLIINY
ncbi:MAG: DNA adenine methylase [Candidatus Gastranaerophilales bacterium]|nr:DNA adenine methylase [Candidatus Gastranaerophilales bacterium]